jgi:23S rRNA (uracil1939-C5)-methyltransferase
VAAEVNMSIDVELTDLAYGGDAVGRYEGRVLFVPGGIPGERVRVEIVEERRGHARANLLEILRPAPERVEPAFPLLTDSGCQWQHIAYPAQLTWKAHIVRQLLVRIGKQPDALVHPTIGMPASVPPWHYRNIHLFSIGLDGAMGLKIAESHDVQDLTDCPLLHPALDQVYQAVRAKLINYFGDSLGQMLQSITLRGAIGAVSNASTSIGINGAKAVPALLTIQARPGSLFENSQQLAQELMTIAPGIVGVIIERVGGRYGRVFAGQEFLTDVVLGRRFASLPIHSSRSIQSRRRSWSNGRWPCWSHSATRLFLTGIVEWASSQPSSHHAVHELSPSNRSLAPLWTQEPRLP